MMRTTFVIVGIHIISVWSTPMIEMHRQMWTEPKPMPAQSYRGDWQHHHPHQQRQEDDNCPTLGQALKQVDGGLATVSETARKTANFFLGRSTGARRLAMSLFGTTQLDQVARVYVDVATDITLYAQHRRLLVQNAATACIRVTPQTTLIPNLTPPTTSSSSALTNATVAKPSRLFDGNQTTPSKISTPRDEAPTSPDTNLFAEMSADQTAIITIHTNRRSYKMPRSLIALAFSIAIFTNGKTFNPSGRGTTLEQQQQSRSASRARISFSGSVSSESCRRSDLSSALVWGIGAIIARAAGTEDLENNLGFIERFDYCRRGHGEEGRMQALQGDQSDVPVRRPVMLKDPNAL